MSEVELDGSCLCGAVTFTARGEPKRFYHCHCSRCRKVSGTGHASNLFLSGSLEWRQGQEVVTHYRHAEAKRFGNAFCRHCGSRLPKFVEEFGVVMIPAGSLDTDSPIRPQARIFCGSRAAWSCDSGELPVFEEYVVE